MSATRSGAVQVLQLDPTNYREHFVHQEGRIWSEVNCYVDLWVELLHSMGLDPVPGLPFVLSAGFEGDQWRFLKYPAEDLRTLYGIEVVELNPWRGTEWCIVDHLALGQLLTVEVDSWFLPDTVGISYRREHVKTTIAPNTIDPDRRQLEYFHATGYHRLTGDDYLGVLPSREDDADRLPPYIELIRLDEATPLQGDELVAATLELTARHLQHGPKVNPVRAMRKRLEADLAWMAQGGIERFHDYAFATLRQCGAGAELAADLCRWLAVRGAPAGAAVDPYLQLAMATKAAQFSLARVSTRGLGSIDSSLDQMEHWWDTATEAMAEIRGR